MLQRPTGLVDPVLPQIQGVVGCGVTDPPARLPDRSRQLRGRVEDRIARWRPRGHRRLHMTNGQVGPLDVGGDLTQHRREVVAAVPILKGRLPDRRMDQQVTIDLDRQLDRWLRRRR